MKQTLITQKQLAVLAVIGIMLAMPLLASASANTIATLNIIPTSDSKVITIIGSGFDPNEPVYLALANATSGVVVYNFTESITTSPIGTFATNLTLPPSTYGIFNIYAQTSTASANKDYSILPALNPKIAVSPANSNIIKVAGSGFSPYDTVFFTLVGIGSPGSNPTRSSINFVSVLNFTDFGVTDNMGNFSVTLIIPTSLSGNYTLSAQTRTGAAANAAITVPDFTGPKGDTGATGDRGAKGATGPAGENQDATWVYVALGLSVLAIVISVWSVFRDREPEED